MALSLVLFLLGKTICVFFVLIAHILYLKLCRVHSVRSIGYMDAHKRTRSNRRGERKSNPSGRGTKWEVNKCDITVTETGKYRNQWCVNILMCILKTKQKQQQCCTIWTTHTLLLLLDPNRYISWSIPTSVRLFVHCLLLWNWYSTSQTKLCCVNNLCMNKHKCTNNHKSCQKVTGKLNFLLCWIWKCIPRRTPLVHHTYTVILPWKPS